LIDRGGGGLDMSAAVDTVSSSSTGLGSSKERSAAVKLIQVAVRRYRSIEEGSTFAIESDVTALVGKNESGKSATLQALYKSQPIEPKEDFDLVLDFPTGKAKERRGDAPVNVTTLTYRLDPSDVTEVEQVLGMGALESIEFDVQYGYRYAKRIWNLRINESAVVKHLVSGLELPPTDQAKVDAVTDVTALASTLGGIETPTPSVTAVATKIAGWRSSSARLAAIDILSPRQPRFVYFADYDIMPGLVSIPDLIDKRDAGTLSRGEQAVVSLLDMADVQLEDFMTPESHEHLIRDSENASNAVSDEVFEFWSQNKNLAVKLSPVERADPQAVAPLNRVPLLQIRVENQRHHVTVPFDERSRGFVWFFSFLAYFAQLEQESKYPLVLLLDEPGINLHAAAQADLLRFIDERLAPSHQVIFTTHSPFMINSHQLHRVRTVIDRDNFGTEISGDVLFADAETAFPLHAAMGIELAQTLFVAPDTLVVEGPSDIMFIEALSDALIGVGREGLDPRWAIAPIGGVTKLPAFVTLLGANKLNIAVIADSSLTDAEAIRKLQAAGRLADAGVITMGDIVNREEADIEDLLEPSAYLKLVNAAYAEALGGAGLKVGDLPAGDRIVQRVAEVFADRGINGGRLNHYTVAKQLLKRADKPDFSASTLDRAAVLIARINARL
jgi:AAA domain, putative AbiEii toxin, Type IV TA system